MRKEINLATGEVLEFPDLPTTTQDISEIRKSMTPISRAQAQLALNQFGLLDAVETYIEKGDKLLKIEWTARNEFKRDNPLLNQAAQMLGLNDDQLDQLFILGATL